MLLGGNSIVYLVSRPVVSALYAFVDFSDADDMLCIASFQIADKSFTISSSRVVLLYFNSSTMIAMNSVRIVIVVNALNECDRDDEARVINSLAMDLLRYLLQKP